MKNITLSAQKEFIELTRKKAAIEGITPNSEFRKWLAAQATGGKERAIRYRQLVKHLSHINAGRKFSREKMNEH